MYAIFTCLPELLAVELVAAAVELEVVLELLLDDPQAAASSAVAARPATVTRPHRLFNVGRERVDAIWVVLGRRGDPRIARNQGD